MRNLPGLSVLPLNTFRPWSGLLDQKIGITFSCSTDWRCFHILNSEIIGVSDLDSDVTPLYLVSNPALHFLSEDVVSVKRFNFEGVHSGYFVYSSYGNAYKKVLIKLDGSFGDGSYCKDAPDFDLETVFEASSFIGEWLYGMFNI